MKAKDKSMQELHALIQQNVTDKVRDQVMDDYYS